MDAPTAAQLELENEMEALTDVSVKGLDEPIHVYRIRA